MSFSLIETCFDCGWDIEDLVVYACVAVVLGIVLGIARYWLRA